MEYKNAPRQRLTEVAKHKAILEVAQAFGMALEKAGKEYNGSWQGHDSFKINPQTNQFYWNGRAFGGGVIDLVSILKYGATSKEETKDFYKRSVVSLAKMELGTFEPSESTQNQTFRFFYKETDNFQLGREFLEQKRGLSSETIDFFLQQGVISQGEYRTELENGEYVYEPVIFFKNLDTKGKAIGGSAHGLTPHPQWPKHTHKSGILKSALINSGSYSGLKVTIGRPKKVICLEAPIDLMAYYELHQATLKDVVLVANDGYKPEAYWRAMAEILVSSPLVDEEMVKDKEWAVQHLVAHPDELRRNYQNFITLSEPEAGQFIFAFDNDKAGYEFLERFKESYPDVLGKIETDFPPLVEGQEKSDWNDELKVQKGLIPRPQSPKKAEEIEQLVSKYTAPQEKTIAEQPPSMQSKYVKQTFTRRDANGKSYSVSKIFELAKLTNFLALDVDQTGRVTLEITDVLTIDRKKFDYQAAKYSVEKTLKNGRFILPVNVSSEALSRPTIEEIRWLRQAKNGMDLEKPQTQTVPPKEKMSKVSEPTLNHILQKRDFNALHQFLNQDLKQYQAPENFQKFLNAMTFMPEQNEKNLRLLLAQNPNVEQVADFTTWSDAKKRRIKPKSKALKIIIPNPQPEYDDKGNMVLLPNGEPQISNISESVVSVFDVSQTTGGQLHPEISHDLSREKGLAIFQKLANFSKLPIRFTEVPLEKDDRAVHFGHSWIDHNQNQLVIQKGLTPKSALQTLVQELVVQNFSEVLQQLEVEAISYVLLRRLGIETELSETVENFKFTADAVQPLLENIQKKVEMLSVQIDKQLKPPLKKNIEAMTIDDKNRKLSLKEKMKAAQNKEEQLIQEVDPSKKVQGAQLHQAPQI
ncbi:toprim domain-containing protein [Lactococcus lactis]|uniref:toprim domain-containing protein n=1 Tax=Lactococcus lactis TaxID=1358 RepID=UPI0018C758EE|nr:toprim domain-containing protein [Lactococcus lactis]MBG1279318.1 DUF3991 domain-containing protein [Lactococcus lactis subsp. lactis]